LTTLSEALAQALDYFATVTPLSEGDELIIPDDCVIERSSGWILYASSKLYSLTHSDDYAVTGVGPVFV